MEPAGGVLVVAHHLATVVDAGGLGLQRTGHLDGGVAAAPVAQEAAQGAADLDLVVAYQLAAVVVVQRRGRNRAWNGDLGEPAPLVAEVAGEWGITRCAVGAHDLAAVVDALELGGLLARGRRRR